MEEGEPKEESATDGPIERVVEEPEGVKEDTIQEPSEPTPPAPSEEPSKETSGSKALPKPKTIMPKKERHSMVMMACFFVLAQIFALFLAIPSKAWGLQAFDNPDDPMNPIYYIMFLMVFTGFILLIVKLKKEKAIKYLFMIAFGMILYTVFSIVTPFVLYGVWLAGLRHMSDLTFYIVEFILVVWLPLFLPVLLLYIMDRNPEWYIVDSIGLITAAGATALLGISLSILPIIILLSGLAIYDAISVYKTKHMVTLADAVTEFKLPVLLVVPKREDYSFKEQGSLKKQISAGTERGAMFMGLGDLVIPGLMVVSAFTFLYPAMDAFYVAMGTLLGALAGYSALMYYVAKGNPQAGLPLLNSGAMGGYIISYLLIFQDIGLGITWW